MLSSGFKSNNKPNENIKYLLVFAKWFPVVSSGLCMLVVNLSIILHAFVMHISGLRRLFEC